MDAAVLTGKKRLEWMRRDRPAPGPGEVLVQVEVCGVCRTDRKAYHMGQRDLHLPRVLGHEVAGRVAETGPGAAEWQVGTRVAVHPGVFCMECGPCREGLDHLCDEMQILGFHLDGGFQPWLLLPAQAVRCGVLLPLPDGLPFWKAALAEPLACAVKMGELLAPRTGGSLFIAGAGALGVLTALLWRQWGAGRITLAEPVPQKRAMAEALGFETVAALPPEEQGRYEAAIPCCPGGEGFESCLRALGRRGRLGFFSGLVGAGPGAAALNGIHYAEQQVYGSYGCGLSDTKKALALLERLPMPRELIHAVRPEQLDLESLEQPEHCITQVHFEHTNDETEEASR